MKTNSDLTFSFCSFSPVQKSSSQLYLHLSNSSQSQNLESEISDHLSLELSASVWNVKYFEHGTKLWQEDKAVTFLLAFFNIINPPKKVLFKC